MILTIPKIIHQTAPKKKKYWHEIWNDCHQSWKKNFSPKQFNHILWSDDDNYDLVKNHYPQYLKLYTSFPLDIFRIDFVRFCYLHKYGGIYSDMDIYCYKNFYHTLSNNIFLLESYVDGELVQNSLMASPPNNDFWIFAMEKSLEYAVSINFDWTSTCKEIGGYNPDLKSFTNASGYDSFVSETNGPKFLSRLYLNNPQYNIHFFNQRFFNPIDIKISFYNLTFDEAYARFKMIKNKETNVYTRHCLSGNWGTDLHSLRKRRIKK